MLNTATGACIPASAAKHPTEALPAGGWKVVTQKLRSHVVCLPGEQIRMIRICVWRGEKPNPSDWIDRVSDRGRERRAVWVHFSLRTGWFTVHCCSLGSMALGYLIS